MKNIIKITLIFALLISIFGCKDHSEQVPLGPEVTASIDTLMQGINDTVWTVNFSDIPYHIQRFESVKLQLDKDPVGASAMFLIAMHIYSRYPNEGTKALITSCGGAAIKQESGPGSYLGKKLLDAEFARIKEQLQRFPGLANAYFTGASPDNNYKPDVPYKIVFSRKQYTPPNPGVRSYVATLGADSDRPIRTLQVGGNWMVEEYSSVLSGIK